MPPMPDSPASMPTRRKTRSSGAPKRSATRLDMMPASTRMAPNRMVMLTESIDAMAAPCPSYWRQQARNATTKLRRVCESNAHRASKTRVNALMGRGAVTRAVSAVRN